MTILSFHFAVQLRPRLCYMKFTTLVLFATHGSKMTEMYRKLSKDTQITLITVKTTTIADRMLLREVPLSVHGSRTQNPSSRIKIVS